MPLTSARLSGNKRLVAASDNRPEIGRNEADHKAVEIIQTCFAELGFDMPRSTKPSGLLDGIYGVETEAVVKQFQMQNGLKADGILGRNTLAKLDAIFDGLMKSDETALRVSLNSRQGWGIS